MATKQTVNWSLSDGAGNPRNGVTITVTPTRSNGTIGALFLTVDGTDISAPLVLSTSGNGAASAALWGNADTKDPTSWYAIDERGSDYFRSYKIQVPNSGGPFNASAIEFQAIQSTSSAVPLDLIDAKGDTFVGTGPDTVDNLPVGPNGQVYTADSSQSGGIAWEAKTAGTVSNDVTTSETTTSATYVALATAGPTVAPVIGKSGMCLVLVSARINNSANGNTTAMGFTINGGAVPGSEVDSAQVNLANAAASTRAVLLTGLTPGTNTFVAVYRVSAGTGTFANRRLVAIPL